MSVYLLYQVADDCIVCLKGHTGSTQPNDNLRKLILG